MSIVLKLQKKCLDSNQDLQSLLRESLVISSKLNLVEFNNWIKYELFGYPNQEITPEYRIVSTTLNFFNPYRGWIPANVPPELENGLGHTKNTQPIGELEHLVKGGDTLSLGLDLQTISDIQTLFGTDFQPRLTTHSSQLYGIIEKVRNLLLEWTLKLEQENILGSDDLIFSDKEKEMAKKNIHIENFNGVMGDISKIGNLSTGDYSSNIYTENNINNEIDKLISEIKKLNLYDQDQIIIDLEASKNDTEKAKSILGGLLSRGAEIASISSSIITLLGLL